MITQTYNDIVTPDLLAGAIENNEYEGFLQDYHVLHCLIRKYQPLSFFEIGTNMGTGTNIICNAGKNWLMKVYSLDLPTELAHVSLQYPTSGASGDKVGSNCKFGYTQLRGDSMEFDYSAYPCEGYFIDGEHDYVHVAAETGRTLVQNPKIVIYHDSDIQGVWDALTSYLPNQDYELYRVTGTRIAYALRKNL